MKDDALARVARKAAKHEEQIYGGDD